ncbi:family 20 glycosylhydrolase [Streptomyces sp. NPDC050619]|uniref:family 20 glycosylhydrolase n=1 Tax=Streptomyces sp. NPDC050619 TaxID=3157214 RepID=UPI0034431CBD
MITIRRYLPSLVVTFGLVLGVLSAGPPAAAAADADRPWTVPALKQWTASSGSFTADAATRVVAAEPALAATARTFAGDLGDLLGREVRVVRGPARPHDVVLRTDRSVRPKAEGYRLSVAATTVISGATDTGVFWGTRSVLQMITQERTLPAGTAKDWPDYPYRGISLCNCSKFFSVPWLVRLIKDMSYLKYNELHLEMRVASTEHPENDSATGPVYSPEQVREIVSAGERYHVQVVQQVGTPGHMDYYLAAHPELQATDTSGAKNTSNLDMSAPSALPYVKSLLDEQMPQFPGSVWYGGGDEYLSAAADYEKYPSLAKWAQEQAGSDAPAADSWVLWQNRVHDYVASKGRTLHVWNDQLFEGMPTKLDPGVAVDYWIHQDGRMTPAEIAANGNDLVNVSDSLYYASGGPPNAQWIYETFTPGLFSGGLTVPADDPHLLGSAMGVWPAAYGDSEATVEQGMYGPLRALAQKNWGSAPLTSTYADFQPIEQAIGHAPGYPTTGTLTADRVYTLRAADGSYAVADGAADRTGSLDTAADPGTAGGWLLQGGDGGVYTLRSQADGRCATVSGQSYTQDARIVTTACDAGSDAQRWLAEPTSTGLVLRSDLSGRVLTAPSAGAGTALVQRYDTGADGQRWTATPATAQLTGSLKTAAPVVPAGGQTDVTVSLTNHGGAPVTLPDTSLDTPAGWTAQPQGTAPAAQLAPGATATLKWTVTVAQDAATGFAQLRAVVSTGVTGATGSVMTTAANLKGATAFDADFVSGTVTPVDLATGTAQDSIAVGKLPGTVLADPSGTTLYVANQGSASVSVIDIATRKVTATIPVGTTPAGLALSPDGKTLWVSAYSDNAVEPVDLATRTAGPEIAVAAGPENLVISPDGKTLWVACRSGNAVVPVDTATRTADTAIPVPDNPFGIAISPDGGTVYVGEQTGKKVLPIDTATRSAGTPIDVGGAPFGLTVSPDGKTLAVGVNDTYTAAFVDLATGKVRSSVLLGLQPTQIAYTPDGTVAYAAVGADGTVVPILTASGETGPPIKVGSYPIGITVVG